MPLPKVKIHPLAFAISIVGLCFIAGITINKYVFVKNSVTKSVYFWKNTFTVSAENNKVLKNLGITKVYCKIMDVDWSPLYHAYPLSETSFIHEDFLKQQFVPVVFITNRTMQKCDKTEISELAKKLWRKIKPLENHFYVNEIQLDCDWTETSRENYFLLIEALKKTSNKEISTTIRLHQYKYRSKTGIPPADKGMLMCYNLGDIKNTKTDNSIYSKKEALKYFTPTTPYPLPLDIALPTFSWGLLFRQNQFAAIIDELNDKKINSLSYLKPISANTFQVMKDTVLARPAAFNDLYLRFGDIIRYEKIDAAAFTSSAKVSHQAINNDNFSVAFFSFDTATINTIGKKTYEKVYNSFIW